MTVAEALRNVTRLFVDSAPVIYYAERHPRYFPALRLIFERLDREPFIAVTSPITLAECLVGSVKRGLDELTQAFWDIILHHPRVIFVPINATIAKSAAELRVRYNLTLPDAFQIAVALQSKCDAFLTNDTIFKRVQELTILLVDELQP
ncbi:MAG: PIN domain-containing protein [Armatimonadetes bacterium]|nr:PIN domain-containing protein [Armatimonadota bacterium]